MKKETLFLTIEETLRAIRIDFNQYDPQILLFAEIIGLISNDAVHIKREPGKNGAWINRQGHTNMQWLDGPDLIAFMCRAVSDATWSSNLLAVICSRVFQTRATVATNSDTGVKGILIETHMEDFNCRQCGNCCRSLDYHNEVKKEDVDRWKTLGRDDILKWVDTTIQAKDQTQYRVWVSPKTGKAADPCPFLIKEPSANIWRCNIHEFKPGICRQYPISRKHALMTGCPGFNRT